MVELSLHSFFGIVNLIVDFIEINEINLEKEDFDNIMLRINNPKKNGEIDIDFGVKML
jgi:hypothetical protein